MNDSTVQHIVSQLAVWWDTLSLLAILLGLCLVIASLILVGQKQSMNQQGNKKAAAMGMLAGLFLINLLLFMDSVSMTLFNKTSATGLGQLDSLASQGQPGGALVQLGLAVVILVGLIGVIRGVLMLNRAGRDSQALGPALSHIIGGMIAVNIVTSLHVFGASLGGSVDSIIARFI